MARFNERLSRIAFGGDYNPEQWDEEVWAEDMRLMTEAGVSMVSLGIFSWAKVEPRPGEYDFGWVDRIFELLSANDIAVCLATMTASPPPWLARLHPETLPMLPDGSRLWPGGRQHYCPSSPEYRRYATRLVAKLAERYGDHPALAMWHIGNEYGCHVPECFCDVSAVAFRGWLRERYGDLDTLNDAWSTSFWSQAYGDWDEIFPPRSVPAFHNPAQRLDFSRFSSDELLACYLAETEITNRVTPNVPVTTNFVGAWRRINTMKWARHMDVVSYDSYPDPHDPEAAADSALAYDLMRSLRDGQPWLLMEQAPSAVNWRERNGAKPRDVMRLWSWQAIAHGADSVLYFQWRASRGGAERFHSGMVPHAGENTRIHREIRQLGNELKGHSALVGTRQTCDVALVIDWDSGWAVEGTSHPSDDVRLMDAVAAHHRPLYDANVAVDFVRPGADLSKYKLVVVPNLYLVSEADARNISDYVHGGGTVLMSFFSGIVDEYDRVHLGGYPAPFRELLGLWIEEFWPLPRGGSTGISFDGDLSALGSDTATRWSEVIRTEGAETLATFAGGDLDGEPAATRHRFGDGEAYYLGTRPSPERMRSLLDHLRQRTAVAPTLADLPDGVQARTRVGEDGTAHHILLNHTARPVTVTVDGAAVELAAHDVAVVTAKA
ncbi:beta-galactosidase [Stackebrandtia nassauensis]|uniref:Beta-galactosidase n=1 Tax=Stackebrandtia nassauensis (strain DSM 44728 / CIP 108903 / NRRL B-16338 / NBRC 102104 / LLR-40K-21) TaxID=446470 RepID=D3Q0A9_STANL|nr:Beta-galactosidase [Stackebrandtia nassauensis DSM 44728]